jgi:hypothetical protein
VPEIRIDVEADELSAEFEVLPQQHRHAQTCRLDVSYSVREVVHISRAHGSASRQEAERVASCNQPREVCHQCPLVQKVKQSSRATLCCRRC